MPQLLGSARAMESLGFHIKIAGICGCSFPQLGFIATAPFPFHCPGLFFGLSEAGRSGISTLDLCFLGFKVKHPLPGKPTLPRPFQNHITIGLRENLFV
jgi:hypothetical protein